MTDREERQHVIEELQNMVDWMEVINYIVATPERIHALGYAIASIKTDLKYDLLYEETSGQADKRTTKKDCNTCTHGNETDGSNCYECVKDMCNNYEPTTKNDLGVDCKTEDYINKRELIQKGMMGCDANGKMLFIIDAEELDSLPSATPKSEWQQDHAINKAYADGYNEGLSVLKDIKSEIQRFKDITSDSNEIHTIDYILSIFDKHISGKENTDDTD